MSIAGIVILVIFLVTLSYLLFELITLWWWRLPDVWDKNAADKRDKVSKILQELTTKIKNIEIKANKYSLEDEYYGSDARLLHQMLQESNQDWNKLKEKINQQPKQKISRVLQPFIDWQNLKKAEQLLESIYDLQNRVNEAENLLKKLRDAPYEIAHQIEGLNQGLATAKKLLDIALRGATIDSISNKLELLDKELQSIPARFYSKKNELLFGGSEEEVQKDVRSAWRILRKAEEPINQIIIDLKKRHSLLKEMEQLLISSKLEMDLKWLEGIENLDKSVKSYAPENWPEGDKTSRLFSDASSIFEKRKALPIRIPKPVTEAQLAQMMKDTKEVIDSRQEFDHRYSRVLEKLNWMHKSENDARQKLEDTLKAIKSLKFLQPDLLFSLGFSEQQSKFTALSEHGEKLHLKLREQHTGLVEDKIKRIERWNKECTDLLKAFHEELQVKSETLKTNLNEKAEGLERYASFAHEPSMIKAHELLEKPFFSNVNASAQKLANQINALILVTREFEQALDAVYNKIEKPIRSLLDDLDNQKAEAEKWFDELVKEQSTQNLWPPIDCNPEKVERFIKAAQERQQSLRHAGTKVEFVIPSLDNIITNYRLAIENASDQLDRIEEQEKNIRGLESDIEKHKLELEAQFDNQAVNKINKEFSAVKQKHKEERLSYAEAKRRLERIVVAEYKSPESQTQIQNVIIQPSQNMASRGSIINNSFISITNPSEWIEQVEKVRSDLESVMEKLSFSDQSVVRNAQSYLLDVIREAQKDKPEVPVIKEAMKMVKGLLDGIKKLEPYVSTISGLIAIISAIFGGRSTP